jgi:hypothetical protein
MPSSSTGSSKRKVNHRMRPVNILELPIMVT